MLDAVVTAAAGMDDDRLPELFSGARRDPRRGPATYGAACGPQTWAAGALPSLLVHALGLQPAALDRRLAVTRPLLPTGVDSLAIRGLRVGDATVDLAFTRGPEGAARLEDATVDGALELAVTASS